MPVVINDFEVVDTPAGAAPRDAGAAPAAAATTLPDAEDLRRLLAEQAEQALRTWSH